jgi:beta-lactam-binding protein with PASTA domain
VRNQSEVVDNLDLSVRGMPDDWWTVTPATAYLVPYGTGGTYEQEIQIHIHPPRTPEAQARTWSIEVVVNSRAYGREVAAAPASVTFGPYFDVGTELRPERGSGRLKARYKLTVRNRANARTEVALAARDTDDECQFRFAEPGVALEPGNALECSFTVFPPKQIWIGKVLERRFEVTADPIGVELEPPPPPLIGAFRQRPWLPWWMAIVLPLLIVGVILLISLLPKQTAVPNLKGVQSMFAAQKILNKAGLKLDPKAKQVVNLKKPPGSIADQSPAAGTKAKKGSVVTVEVFVGTGKVKVPSVVGDTPGLADQALRASNLALGAVSPQPLNPNGKIASQIPVAGAQVTSGTAVAVFLAQPAAAKGAKKGGVVVGGGTPTTGSSSGSTTASSSSGAQAGGSQITVPKLTGDPTAAAAKLSQLGLTPKLQNELATVPVGQVAGTKPAAGAKVSKGATVQLLVSSGAPQLAFDDGEAVHVIDPPSVKPSGVVPTGATPQVEPAWSFDGSRLVYSEAGSLMLASPNTKGSQAVALTRPATGVSDLNPSFAPTLKSHVLAFIERDASGAKLCFATVGPFLLNSSCTTAPGFDLGGEIDWSPKGNVVLVLGTQDKGAKFGLLAFTSNVPFSTQGSDWGHGTLETDDSVAQHGVFAAAFSPDGKKIALVSNVGATDFSLYIAKAGNFTPQPADQLPVRACQISWRSDGQQLAVMQPNGLCTPNATGTIVAIDPANPRNPTTLATNAAHPAWEPVPGG